MGDPTPDSARNGAGGHLGSPGDRSWSPRDPSATYRCLRSLTHAINRVYWRVETEGTEGIPASGPVIIAPVHRSFMDFFVASELTRRKLYYMAKDDLWSSPTLGRLVESLGAFPVNRAGADRVALGRAQQVLEAGQVLVLFPEGTRREGPLVEDLHEGAAFLASRTGAPIVPVGIGGTEGAMPKGSRLPKPVKVVVVAGEPIYPPVRTPGGHVPRRQVRELTAELRDEIQRLFDLARHAAGLA